MLTELSSTRRTCSIESPRDSVAPLPLRGMTGEIELSTHGLRCVRLWADSASPVATVPRPFRGEECMSLQVVPFRGEEESAVARWPLRGEEDSRLSACWLLYPIYLYLRQFGYPPLP